MYFCESTNSLKWRTNMKLNKSVEVKELQEMNVAYVRHIGPYQGNDKLFQQLWNKLFAWAGPRGLIGGPDFKSLIIYHDDPNLCEGDKLRTSVCITVITSYSIHYTKLYDISPRGPAHANNLFHNC